MLSVCDMSCWYGFLYDGCVGCVCYCVWMNLCIFCVLLLLVLVLLVCSIYLF